MRHWTVKYHTSKIRHSNTSAHQTDSLAIPDCQNTNSAHRQISLWPNANVIVSVQGCDVDQVALTYHLWIPVFHLPKIGPLSTPDSCALRRIVHEVALCDNARWIKNRHSKVWWQIYMRACRNYGARLWCNVWQSDETNATIRNLLDSFKARDTAWWWTYWLICTKLARMWNRLAIPCVTSICDPIILRLGYWGRISCEHRNRM